MGNAQAVPSNTHQVVQVIVRALTILFDAIKAFAFGITKQFIQDLVEDVTGKEVDPTVLKAIKVPPDLSK